MTMKRRGRGAGKKPRKATAEPTTARGWSIREAHARRARGELSDSAMKKLAREERRLQRAVREEAGELPRKYARTKSRRTTDDGLTLSQIRISLRRAEAAKRAAILRADWAIEKADRRRRRGVA